MPEPTGLVVRTVDGLSADQVRVLRTAVHCTQVAVEGARAHFHFPSAETTFFDEALSSSREVNATQTRTPIVYYDINSPFAYLATRIVDEIESDTGAEFEWRGFQLFPAWRPFFDVKGPASQQRWANNRPVLLDHGLSVGDERPPLRNTCYVLAALEVARCVGHFKVLRDRVFRAHWSESANIENLATIRDLATEVGLDGSWLVDLLRQGVVDGLVTLHRAVATAKGVFGVPTVVIGDTVIWGQNCEEEIRRVLASR